MSKNSHFDEEEFCDQLNVSLWELGFDEMRKRPSLAKALEFCGPDRVGTAFFKGVSQFINEIYDRPLNNLKRFDDVSICGNLAFADPIPDTVLVLP